MDARDAAGEPPWRELDPLRWLLAPALVALVACAGTLDGGFVSDDFHLVEQAAQASDWRAAGLVRYSPVESWLRPLVHWSFWLQWLTSGAEPFAYHLFNVALHALNCVQVAWLAGVLLRARGAGALAGVAFALHPIHPEAVAWVSGRSDLLCAAGALGCLLAWTRWCAPGGRGLHLVLAGLGLLFSVFSKEMGVVTVALATVVSVGFYRSGLRRQLAGVALLVALTAAYLAARYQLLGGLGGSIRGDVTSLQTHADPAYAVWFTLRAVEYVAAPVHRALWSPLPFGLLGVQLAGWLTLGLLGLRSRERGRLWRVGLPLLALFLVTLLPLANWAYIARDFKGTRFLYLPSAFACLGLALLATRTPGPRAWSAPRVVALVLVLAPWSGQLLLVGSFWSEAGSRAVRIVASLPATGPEVELFVTDLPDTHEGAYVFRNAFPNAARLAGVRARRIEVLAPAEWELLRGAAVPAGRPPRRFLRWRGAALGWSDAPRTPPAAGDPAPR